MSRDFILGRGLPTVPQRNTPTQLAFSPDGETLYANGAKAHQRVRLGSGAVRRTIDGLGGVTLSPNRHPDGRRAIRRPGQCAWWTWRRSDLIQLDSRAASSTTAAFSTDKVTAGDGEHRRDDPHLQDAATGRIRCSKGPCRAASPTSCSPRIQAPTPTSAAADRALRRGTSTVRQDSSRPSRRRGQAPKEARHCRLPGGSDHRTARGAHGAHGRRVRRGPRHPDRQRAPAMGGDFHPDGNRSSPSTTPADYAALAHLRRQALLATGPATTAGTSARSRSPPTATV